VKLPCQPAISPTTGRAGILTPSGPKVPLPEKDPALFSMKSVLILHPLPLAARRQPTDVAPLFVVPLPDWQDGVEKH